LLKWRRPPACVADSRTEVGIFSHLLRHYGQVRIELEMWMRFGLHFAFAEATKDFPVLREHPDWTSSETYGYHGGVSLCLSNRPTQEWIMEQAIRMIDDYGVDWILQDGENMVKECAKYRVSQIHSHIPGRA